MKILHFVFINIYLWYIQKGEKIIPHIYPWGLFTFLFFLNIVTCFGFITLFVGENILTIKLGLFLFFVSGGIFYFIFIKKSAYLKYMPEYVKLSIARKRNLAIYLFIYIIVSFGLFLITANRVRAGIKEQRIKKAISYTTSLGAAYPD